MNKSKAIALLNPKQARLNRRSLFKPYAQDTMARYWKKIPWEWLADVTELLDTFGDVSNAKQNKKTNAVVDPLAKRRKRTGIYLHIEVQAEEDPPKSGMYTVTQLLRKGGDRSNFVHTVDALKRDIYQYNIEAKDDVPTELGCQALLIAAYPVLEGKVVVWEGNWTQKETDGRWYGEYKCTLLSSRSNFVQTTDSLKRDIYQYNIEGEAVEPTEAGCQTLLTAAYGVISGQVVVWEGNWTQKETDGRWYGEYKCTLLSSRSNFVQTTDSLKRDIYQYNIEGEAVEPTEAGCQTLLTAAYGVISGQVVVWEGNWTQKETDGRWYGEYKCTLLSSRENCVKTVDEYGSVRWTYNIESVDTEPTNSGCETVLEAAFSEIADTYSEVLLSRRGNWKMAERDGRWTGDYSMIAVAPALANYSVTKDFTEVRVLGNAGFSSITETSRSYSGSSSTSSSNFATRNANSSHSGKTSVYSSSTGASTRTATNSEQQSSISDGTGETSTASQTSGTSSVNSAQSGTSVTNSTSSGTSNNTGTNSGTSIVSSIQSGTSNVNGTNSGTSDVNSIQSGTSSVNGTNSGTSSVASTRSGTSSVNSARSGTSVVSSTNSGTSTVHSIGTGEEQRTTTNNSVRSGTGVTGSTATNHAGFTRTGSQSRTGTTGRTSTGASTYVSERNNNTSVDGSSWADSLTTYSAFQTQVSEGDGAGSGDNVIIRNNYKSASAVGSVGSGSWSHAGTTKQSLIFEQFVETNNGNRDSLTTTDNGRSSNTLSNSTGSSETTSNSDGTNESTSASNSEGTSDSSNTGTSTRSFTGSTQSTSDSNGTRTSSSDRTSERTGTSDSNSTNSGNSDVNSTSTGTSQRDSTESGTNNRSSVTSGTSTRSQTFSGTNVRGNTSSGTSDRNSTSSGTSNRASNFDSTHSRTSEDSGTSDRVNTQEGTSQADRQTTRNSTANTTRDGTADTSAETTAENWRVGSNSGSSFRYTSSSGSSIRRSINRGSTIFSATASSASKNVTIVTITWRTHIQHHLTYSPAIDEAYQATHIKPSVSGLSFGIAQLYRSTWNELLTASVELYSPSYAA